LGFSHETPRDNNNHKLATNCGDWANTVVLIIWDHWGGWYHHVLHLALQQRGRL
jgi:hypothetical protein